MSTTTYMHNVQNVSLYLSDFGASYIRLDDGKGSDVNIILARGTPSSDVTAAFEALKRCISPEVK